MQLKTVAFFLALSAYSWGVAYVGHIVTWTDTTEHADPFGEGQVNHWRETSPRWYSLPLLGNILGVYVLFVVVAVKHCEEES